MLALAGSARADWHEASSKHFVVYSELPPAKLKSFAERLERFNAVVRLVAGMKGEVVGKANRLTVYMVDDTADVARLSSRGAAGFYIPRASGSLAIVPRAAGQTSNDLSAQAILFHEYAHHLMFSSAANAVYPAWYIEGWAETLATLRFYDEDSGVDLGRPPQYRADGLLLGNALPIEKLLIADTLKLNDQQTDGLYGRGWLLSHYLMLSGERKGQLDAYLVGISAGKPPLEAAKVFGSLRTLDAELERYKTGRFKVIKFGTEKLTIPPVEIRPLTAGEAATMDVRVRSKVGVNAKSAPGVYARAKRAAAGFAGDAGAQIVLAEAAFDAGDFAEAEAAADRAIAADAKVVDGYLYKAMARMAVAAKAGDKKPETWRAIRAIIAAGNRVDPDDPEALILYYRSYLEAGVPVTANAKDGLRRALELCPQDDRLRFTVAVQYLRDKDKSAARTLLAPLAYRPHGRGIARIAAQAIEMIDKGEADAALGKLAGEEEEKDAGDDAS